MICPDYYDQLCITLGQAMARALQKHSQVPPAEPQLVANLVFEIPRAVNGWHQPGLTIHSSGVFVHGQPFVKYANPPNPKTKSVEIGDLLLLRTVTGRNPLLSGEAILLQAKKDDHFPTRPGNVNQHYLYAKWPKFEYVRSTPSLNRQLRHVTGSHKQDAGKYLLLRTSPFCSAGTRGPLCRQFCSSCAVTARATQPLLSDPECFISELASLVLYGRGKAFTRSASRRTTNWSRVITDLMGNTYHQTSVYMQRASGIPWTPRGMCLCFTAGEADGYGMLDARMIGNKNLHAAGDLPPVVATDVEFDDDIPEGGISILEFVVTHDEEDRAQY